MKIKYIHASAPKAEKIHDTVRAYRNCLGVLHALGSTQTQDEYDQGELSRFERDKRKGLILSYQIVDMDA